MTSDFKVELSLADFRMRYIEARRSVSTRIEMDSQGEWWLRPETITWWKRQDDSAVLAGDVVKEPVRDDERETIISRVIAEARGPHRLWLNVKGRTAEPRPPTWKAPPVRTDVDPELAFILEGEMPLPGGPSNAITLDDDARLLADIQRALEQVQPMADANWEPAQSMVRQLRWCRGKLRGEIVEQPPGPFSMGLMATREFDMYGSQPELAMLINSIQTEMKRRGFP